MATAAPAQGGARPLRVLLLNLRTDVNDTALGFTAAWVNELARHCESVDVITMHAGEYAVASNVTVSSMGGERGWSEPRRAAQFYRHLARLTAGGRIDACFAHMAPLFAAMTAPVARVRGFPILLWYAHGSVPWELRLAEPLVDRCVASTPSGFNLPSRKLRILSQGIDTERFRPPSPPHDEAYEDTVLSIGRISRRKGVAEVVDAVALRRAAGDPLRLVLVGGALTEDDVAYERELRERVRAHGMEPAVTFAGPVPYAEIPAAYRRGGTFANVSETGSLDKAILEAMASGCLVASRNASFARIARDAGLEELIPAAGAAGLAATLDHVRRLPPDARAALRARSRALVASDHGLGQLMERIAGELRDLADGRRPRGRARTPSVAGARGR